MKDWMLLLYSILEGDSIDVDSLISSNIVRATNSAPVSILFCRLITSLCAQAREPIDSREEFWPPTTP